MSPGRARFSTEVHSDMSKIYNLARDLTPSTFSIASAVLTGTVDFSTTILELLETAAIIRAAPSQ